MTILSLKTEFNKLSEFWLPDCNEITWRSRKWIQVNG